MLHPQLACLAIEQRIPVLVERRTTRRSGLQLCLVTLMDAQRTQMTLSKENVLPRMMRQPLVPALEQHQGSRTRRRPAMTRSLPAR